MDESILTSVKAYCGIPEGYDVFDDQLIGLINGVFTILCQLGVGPGEEFSITGDEETWGDFMPNGRINLVRAYVEKKVRVMFDTSTISSYALESLNKEINEYEWRLNVLGDTT